MKVGIDYWPATTHGPGVGRYVRELVRALVRLEDAPELVLLDVGPGARTMEPSLGLEGSRARRVKAKLPRRVLELAGALGLGADRLLGCDLVHGVFPGVPRVARARRTIALSEFPAEGTQLEGYDAVITFSAWAADELASRYRVPRERVHALPVGCEHWKRGLAQVPARAEPPVVLALGRIAKRRAPTAVLAACERLRARGVACQLSFVGRRGDAYDELRARVTRSPMSASVRFDSEPDERTLPAAVARASVLVHLSDLELSPVTPLEALACGCALVASRLPAFEEALGQHAHWVAGAPGELDPEALASALETALRDARDEVAGRARGALAARFSWERHARLTLELWRRILS